MSFILIAFAQSCTRFPITNSVIFPSEKASPSSRRWNDQANSPRGDLDAYVRIRRPLFTVQLSREWFATRGIEDLEIDGAGTQCFRVLEAEIFEQALIEWHEFQVPNCLRDPIILADERHDLEYPVV